MYDISDILQGRVAGAVAPSTGKIMKNRNDDKICHKMLY